MQSPLIKGLLVFAIVFLAFFFYKRNIEHKKPTTPEVEVAVEQKLSTDFKEFYDHFQSDSLFQLDHITFPLEKISENAMDDQSFWLRETWSLHHPFNNMNGAFERSFESTPYFVNERIIDLTGEFSMTRRFAKLSDGWNLIYYKPMGKYGQSEAKEEPKIEIKQIR